MSPSTSLRSLGPRVALLIFTCAGILVVGEIAARIAALRALAPEESPDPSLPVVETLAELRRPSWEGVYKGVHHRSNSMSMRGPEYTRMPAPGVLRIAIVGDSLTMGQGVAEEAAYPALLEARLRDDGVAAEVLNMGMSGANTVSSSKRLARLAAWYAPHFAIYGFTINDIEGPEYRPPERPEAARRVRTIFKWKEAARYDSSPSYLLRWIWPRWVLLRGFDDLEIGLVDRTLEHNYFDNAAAWDDLRSGLDRLAETGRERGICLVVFLHTHLAELTEKHAYTRIYERMKGAAAARGLPVIESFPAFAGRDETRLWVSRADSHPNREGHEILAEALYDGLSELAPPCRLFAPDV